MLDEKGDPVLFGQIEKELASEHKIYD